MFVVAFCFLYVFFLFTFVYLYVFFCVVIVLVLVVALNVCAGFVLCFVNVGLYGFHGCLRENLLAAETIFESCCLRREKLAPC